MNAKLQSALAELEKAGAKKLPNEETVEIAKDGKIWSGKKANGDLWVLTKNNEDSYNCIC